MPINYINDIALYYESHGTGKPFVWICPFESDHSTFSIILDVYAKTHQVILLDNRGTGRSSCPDVPYSIETMAEDVFGLCQSLGLKKCHFLGPSMGGCIVQVLAHRYPQIVESIILCNSLMKLDVRFALFAKARLVHIQEQSSRRALIEGKLGWVLSSNFLKQPGMMESLIEMDLSNPYPITETGYRRQLEALLEFNSRPWVSQINVPTLILGSDRDMIIEESHFLEMTRLVPHAHYHSFQGTGHVPFLEQPKKFHEIIYNFINNQQDT